MKQLYAHQQRILDRNPKRFLIAHGTGTGKTLLALELAKKNAATALIIVPKAIKTQWQVQAGAYNPKHLVVTKEEFRKDMRGWRKIGRYDAVIADEAHYFTGQSHMKSALMAYIKIHNPTCVWLLTATPYLSTPLNIYRLGLLLGADKRFYSGWSYWYWRQSFFQEVRMGARVVPLIRKGIEKKLRAKVLEIGDTCDLAECIDIPDQTDEVIYFETTKEQDKAIESLQDPIHITRWTHEHTIENGVLYGDGYVATQTFECLKNDYIASLAAENPKLAVFCRYNEQIKILAKRLEKQGKEVLVVTGQTPDRHEVIARAEMLPDCAVIINAACAEGYELPSFPIIVFASLDFSYKNYVQAKGRFLRINKPKKNHYIHLVVKDGPDEAVYEAILKKQSFSWAVYGKIKECQNETSSPVLIAGQNTVSATLPLSN